MLATMTTDRTNFKIVTESRGARWVAWVATDESDAPFGSVLLMGRTQAEAEANAQAWADKLANDPVLATPARNPPSFTPASP